MGEARRGWAYLIFHAPPAAAIGGGYTVRSRVPGVGVGGAGESVGGKWAVREVQVGLRGGSAGLRRLCAYQ